MAELPQVCRRCHKLKLPTLGRYSKVAGREHDRRWVCYSCLGKPRPIRCANTAPSPLELAARRAAMDTGYRFVEEFPLGPFRFDLAFPALRLLLEIDSSRWHHHASRKSRDRRKEKAARAESWEVLRVTSRRAEPVEFLVRQAIMRRESELAITPES